MNIVLKKKILVKFIFYPLYLFLGFMITSTLIYFFNIFYINQNQSFAINNFQNNFIEGKRLFEANCSNCHGSKGLGNPIGPNLIGKGYASVDFQVGTGRMPMQMQGPQAQSKPKQFNDQQIDQLATYIDQIGDGPKISDPEILNISLGNPAKGGEVFRTNCAMCHNAAGAGGALTHGKFAPALSGVSEKHIYEAMLTGPQNMPVFNDSNITPENKRNIISFLKFIEKENSPGGLSLGSIGPVAEGLLLWTAVLTIIIWFSIWLTRKVS